MHVIATAGHVDHGKSTLVQALTGMDPDRWEAERRRGLTIDLGYAWLTLPSGEKLAFVDVPGHERFVPNMLAGVGPVPAVLFVVAADGGWKPQSAEHLAVLDALGIRHGLLVVTRSDLADPGPVMAEASRLIAASSLGQVEALAVSAVTGDGLPDLVEALARLAGRLPVPDPGAPVRIWVDRSFSITGSGTVVTGTLPAGAVHRGDELVVTPSMRPVRVRGLQALGEPATDVTGPARVAVNLRGTSHERLGRGMALVQPGRWTLTDVIDVRFTAAGEPTSEQADDGAPRLPRTVTLHVGAARTPARVRPLGGRIARLTLREALPLHVGDRVLLRDPGASKAPPRGAAAPRSAGPVPGPPLPGPALSGASVSVSGPPVSGPPVSGASVSGVPVPGPPGPFRPGPHGPGEQWPSILGAVVLDVAPPPLRRRGAAASAAAELGSWPDPPTAAELLRRHGLLRASALLAMGVSEHPEPVSGEWLADPGHWADLAARLGEAVTAHVAREPLAPGLPLEAARAALGLPDRRLVDVLVRPPLRVREGMVQVSAPADGTEPPGLPPTVAAAVRVLLADLATAPFASPDADRLRHLGLDLRAIAAAERAGLLLRVSDQIVLAPGADAVAGRVLADLPQPFTAAEARQALKTTRRVAIPLLEFLDRAGVTLRLPDDRRRLVSRPGD
jgi:selenocysteine-specific elongation factor